MLFTNIILTIKTEPGYIPDYGEWDMNSGLNDSDMMPEEEKQEERSHKKKKKPSE